MAHHQAFALTIERALQGEAAFQTGLPCDFEASKRLMFIAF